MAEKMYLYRLSNGCWTVCWEADGSFVAGGSMNLLDMLSMI